MEDDYRPFEAVNIGLASVETGQERFTRDGIYGPPPLAYWRCNLTALSQRFNLYFVATKDTIAVYRPDFPFQRLHRLPEFVIAPKLANPNANGYIDERVAQAVNHLTVGDLGSEEILLLATDSGNVTAYYTKTINDFICKKLQRLATDVFSDHYRLRPFFTQWVHESAWGLAIHTKARMIAVSANTPHHTSNDDPCSKITVFAFALTATTDSGEDGDDFHDIGAEDLTSQARTPDWEEWTETGVRTTPPERSRNYKITLAGVEGHDHNIPCIAFVNTDDDLDGSWLLSTDIGGDLKLWQVWQGICQKSWDFSERRVRSGFFRRREGGWLVAALDPRSFRTAKTMDEFCGHSKAPQYHGHNTLESYDLTHVVRLRTPGNSHAHPLMYASIEDDNEGDDYREHSDSWSTLDDASVDVYQSRSNTASQSAYDVHHSSTVMNREAESSSNRPTVPSETLPDDDLPSDPSDDGDILSLENMVFEDADDSEPGEDEDVESTSGAPFEDDDNSSISHRSTTSLPSPPFSNSPEIEVDVLSSSDMDSSARKQLAVGKHRHYGSMLGNDSSVVRAHGTASAPSIPTLHCSASNLRLLMAPQADSPHVFCANILKQALPPAIEASNHSHIDRLNMVLQIPELGIVLVATQLGRCAVCTLTRNEKTDTLGLRVDWILPTKKQEVKGLRPMGPLLGIAAAPIQGRQRGHGSSSSSVANDTSAWGKDSVVDGTPTTFDRTVFVVNKPSTDQHRNEDVHSLKRKRLYQPLSKTEDQKTRLEERDWKVPPATEPWQAMEGGRRYRLMLTYLDMTVLTYELSRGIEKDDVAREEIISSLELLD